MGVRGRGHGPAAPQRMQHGQAAAQQLSAGEIAFFRGVAEGTPTRIELRPHRGRCVIAARDIKVRTACGLAHCTYPTPHSSLFQHGHRHCSVHSPPAALVAAADTDADPSFCRQGKSSGAELRWRAP